MSTVSNELREMLPTWAVTVLLPVPIATFWQVGPGRDFAYAYLFLGCAILTAERFARPVDTPSQAGAIRTRAHDWRARITALGLAVTGAAAILTTFVWAMTGCLDAGVPLFAILAVVPAVCCVPYVAITTGRPYLAVLFAVVVLAGVKMVGCVVVVLIHGWNAQEAGHTMLPWERPNLLVWLCLSGALVCSVVLYALGRRAFLKGGTLAQPTIVNAISLQNSRT